MHRTISHLTAIMLQTKGLDMLLFFIIPIVIAGIRKYRPKHALVTWELYPLYLVEAVHIFFQINAYFGNFTFVRYSSYVQAAMNLSLLVPIISKRLYWQALAGSGGILIGSLLNKIVIDANNGHMPVYATLSKITGYFQESALESAVDEFHILMNESTSMNFLGDYIDLGFCILSPGDVLIHLFISVVIYYTIKMSVIKTNKAVTKGESDG